MALADREHRHALGQPRAEQRAGRLGQEDLTAVADRADPRRSHDVEADVALLVERGLARVEPDPHSNGRVVRPRLDGMRALSLDGRGHGVTGSREDEEERVSLGVHLDALRGRERLAHDPSVRAQDLGVPVAEALQELGRLLDVGEREGDGSLWQFRHGTIVRPRPHAARRRQHSLWHDPRRWIRVGSRHLRSWRTFPERSSTSLRPR